jgi:hypothetical protein
VDDITQPIPELRWPKKIFCYKNGNVIIRPVIRYEVAEQTAEGEPGPIRAIPHLERNEFMIYDNIGKIIIIDKIGG